MWRAFSIGFLLIFLTYWQPLPDLNRALGISPRTIVVADLGNTIDEIAEMLKSLGKRLRSIRPRVDAVNMRYALPSTVTL